MPIDSFAAQNCSVARTLSIQVPGAAVTHAIPNSEAQPQPEDFRVTTFNRRSLPGIIRAHDVIVAQYVPAYALPFVLDKRLVLGSVVFGIGWGLAGFCPGPALVAIGAGQAKAFAFVAAMLAGMAAFELRGRGTSLQNPTI